MDGSLKDFGSPNTIPIPNAKKSIAYSNEIAKIALLLGPLAHSVRATDS
jgi:hypothetical protein